MSRKLCTAYIIVGGVIHCFTLIPGHLFEEVFGPFARLHAELVVLAGRLNADLGYRCTRLRVGMKCFISTLPNRMALRACLGGLGIVDFGISYLELPLHLITVDSQ